MRFRDLAWNSGRPFFRASAETPVSIMETPVSIMAMVFGVLLHWLRDFFGWGATDVCLEALWNGENDSPGSGLTTGHAHVQPSLVVTVLFLLHC